MDKPTKGQIDPQQHIEALIFASEQSISAEEIASCLSIVLETSYSTVQVREMLESIRIKYEAPQHIMELRELADGFQFLTKKVFSGTLSVLVQQKDRKKLSQSALETLAIIAYKQPVTRIEIEQIRGVNCDYAVQKLLEKELIQITGKTEGPGRPLLYGTSKLFMDHFGLLSLNDLPQLKDIQPGTNEIGISSEE